MKKALTMLKARSTVRLFHETIVTKKKRIMTKFLKLAVLNNQQTPLFQKEKTIITTTTVEKTTMVMLIATVHPF